MVHTLHLLSFSYFSLYRDDPSLSDRTDPPDAAAARVRLKCSIRLPTKYSEYVDSDTVVKQLLVLGDDELSLPVDNNLSFYLAIRSVASCSLVFHTRQRRDQPSQYLRGQKVQILDQMALRYP